MPTGRTEVSTETVTSSTAIGQRVGLNMERKISKEGRTCAFCGRHIYQDRITCPYCDSAHRSLLEGSLE